LFGLGGGVLSPAGAADGCGVGSGPGFGSGVGSGSGFGFGAASMPLPVSVAVTVPAEVCEGDAAAFAGRVVVGDLPAARLEAAFVDVDTGAFFGFIVFDGRLVEFEQLARRRVAVDRPALVARRVGAEGHVAQPQVAVVVVDRAAPDRIVAAEHHFFDLQLFRRAALVDRPAVGPAAIRQSQAGDRDGTAVDFEDPRVPLRVDRQLGGAGADDRERLDAAARRVYRDRQAAQQDWAGQRAAEFDPHPFAAEAGARVGDRFAQRADPGAARFAGAAAGVGGAVDDDRGGGGRRRGGHGDGEYQQRQERRHRADESLHGLLLGRAAALVYKRSLI
jgi:hypothetical protein